ncbi:hypothetical protein DE146DRAFT_142788 [Phaeosphaeria sp. MPI-PUGE-AT-0046c]|nr:hypothetical protein DE146DRAFT_142788 [Phaeosphaeria sp. MPI-PUGE-AT-0046c]
MEKLPFELLSVIFEHLQEWNTIDQPFSYLTETSRYSDQSDGWLVHTTASRENICNFRLMGRKYRSSSVSAFGGLLGNRVFRLTKVGLDDLKAISSVAALRPYIDTLTFGSAQFAEPGELEGLWTLLPEPARTRVRVAYAKAFEWQTRHGQTQLHQRFEVILNALPKLHNLRLHPFDDARNHNPLGGWLTGDDYSLIREAWHDLVSRRNLIKIHPYLTDLSTFAPILNAITSTAKEIRDFRLAPPWSVKAFCFYTALKDTNIVSHLRTLRFDLEWRYLPPEPGPPWDDLPKAFGYFVNVTHLTINIWKHSLTRDDKGSRKSLLHMLSPIKQLKKFVIGGHCHFREDELVGFLARHNATLEVLALKKPIMSDSYGSWTSTTQQILQLPFPALQYLEIYAMRVCATHRDFPLAFTDATEWDEFLSAIKDSRYNDAKFTLLSELEIATVRYVCMSLRPPPTIKLSSQQPPILPEYILRQRQRKRAALDRWQQMQQTQQIV